MIVTAHRLRSIGWFALLAICLLLVTVLAFRVNALRSQVHHAEMKIVALRQEKMYLETEFETRANQQQLKAWNDVEFGYVAPTAGQYLENERQLAALSKPSEPDAPEPIRVASADDAVVAQAAFPTMVSPLSGKPLGAQDDKPSPEKADHAKATASLGERLATVEHDGEEPIKPRIRQLVAKDDDAGPAKKSPKPAKAEKKDKPVAKAASTVAKRDTGRKASVRNDKPVDKVSPKPSAKLASATKPAAVKKPATAAKKGARATK